MSVNGTVLVALDHKIRVRLHDLPDGAAENIVEALTILNREKAAAQKQDIWGWQNLPDHIHLWEVEDDMLVMPRGFLNSFLEGLKIYGAKVEVFDRRAWKSLLRLPPVWVDGDVLGPRPWQAPAIEAILHHKQGIYKAPAGSGKTVTILLAIQKLGCKSIVIVNTKDIVWQWQERVANFLGEHYPCGQIGDGVFEVSPYITIATAQTLHSRFEELERDGFFDSFSFMCLDECHHATAETYNRLVDRFSSKYRVGVSATPDKTGDFALATHVLGPVFHETKPREVDSLIVPRVQRVPTDFTFGFRGHRSRYQRSNYPQMIDALIRNRERNELIVRMIRMNESHHQLVVSKRLEHLDLLHSMLAESRFGDPLMMLTGDSSNENRQEAKELLETRPSVVFSTLADEAMDIPRLDRMHLAFPQRNAGLVIQQVGRAEREHPDKKDAIIYDYADLKVGPLAKQWQVRRFEVYEPRGYEIALQLPDLSPVA